MRNQTRNLVFTAMCLALAVVLPMAFHVVPNAGSVLLPMHIPVLLCGLLCGPVYGLACGVLAPALSSLITQMPPAAVLPSMICELAVYGLLAGLLIRLIHTKSQVGDIYLSLLGAMLCGRVVYGVVNAAIFQAGSYSLQIWLTASFVTALPGIVIQIVFIPLIVFALRKAKLAHA
ncbi:MAG TPA: ECF transporter S component [Candidatus Caccousia avistercoris]|nr:ECF transporter S component [Candidatus Caccousia avistercoris]